MIFFFIIACIVISLVCIVAIVALFQRLFPRSSINIEQITSHIRANLRNYLIFGLAFFFVSSFDIINPDSFPPYGKLIYAIMMISSMIILIVGFIRYSAQAEGMRIIGIPLSIAILFQIGLGMLVGLFNAIVTSNETTALTLVIISLVIFTYLIFEEFKLLSGTAVRGQIIPWRIIISGIFSYLVINLFVLMIFGFFNIAYGLTQFQIDLTNATAMQVLHAGGIFFFQYPQLDNSKIVSLSEVRLLIPFIQYYAGIIFNFMVLPFFISYFSSRISTSQQQI